MYKNFLKEFPAPEIITSKEKERLRDFNFTANGHIHTPYSFSAFDNIESLFIKAKKEGIDVLGINDFYVTDGYGPFHDGCVEKGIFPLFNIEFIGLMKMEQKEGIRINDPNNPGRIYFCGKGLDFPFHLNRSNLEILLSVQEETQVQIKAMVVKLNELIGRTGSPLKLDFETIKGKYAKSLVRERHIAKAIRCLAVENLPTDVKKIEFIEALYGGKRSKYTFSEPAALENEIRSNLLKAGGAAFVEEDERSFLPVERIIELIHDAGGIPCYPVLLDDSSGKFTEFESDRENLDETLKGLGVGCIELIPGRNSPAILADFVKFFDSKDFIIIFGTEHNTPEMNPLRVAARGNIPLAKELEQIGLRGVCVIAGHQYLRSQNRTGYIGEDGKPQTYRKKEVEDIGRSVIGYFLSRYKK